jgi:hypothetical protein
MSRFSADLTDHAARSLKLSNPPRPADAVLCSGDVGTLLPVSGRLDVAERRREPMVLESAGG